MRHSLTMIGTTHCIVKQQCLWYHMKQRFFLNKVRSLLWRNKWPWQRESPAKTPYIVYILALVAHISKANSVTPISCCWKVIRRPRWNYLHSIVYIVYAIESAAYGVLVASCLCQKPERAGYERVRTQTTSEYNPVQRTFYVASCLLHLRREFSLKQFSERKLETKTY